MASLKKVVDIAEQNTVSETAVTSQVDNETVFDFLAGYVDKDGVCHKEFELREMTGRDEEILRKADANKNASKAIRELLSRCIVRIGTYTRSNCPGSKWDDIIKSLIVFDQDYALMQLRKISISGEIKVEHTCPNPDCKAKLETVLDIDELECTDFKGERVVKFELPSGYVDKNGEVHKLGTLRLPTGLDREIFTPLAKQNPARATTSMLTRLCKFDDGYPITEDVMGDLKVRDRKYLSELLDEQRFGYVLEVDVECDQCGETFKGSLSTSNFI